MVHARPLAILAIFITCACAAAQTPAVLPGVVPAVQSWTPAAGTWDIRGATIQPPPNDREAAALATQLAGELGELRGKGQAEAGVIQFIKEPADPTRPEGYVLEIGDSVTLRAAGTAGFYYGTRTLLQLARRNPHLPKGKVSDWPEYSNRMLMLEDRPLVPDTGAESLLLFDPDDRLSVTPLPGLATLTTTAAEAEVRLARLRELRVGGMTLRDVPTVLAQRDRSEPAEIDGLLPLHLFDRVTFDGPRKRLIVEKNLADAGLMFF